MAGLTYCQLLQHPDDRISPVQDAALRVQTRIIRAVADSQEQGVTARLLISSNQIGCLLGRGGAIIAEMRKLSRAHIRILGKDQIPKCASEDEEVVLVCLIFSCGFMLSLPRLNISFKAISNLELLIFCSVPVTTYNKHISICIIIVF